MGFNPRNTLLALSLSLAACGGVDDVATDDAAADVAVDTSAPDTPDADVPARDVPTPDVPRIDAAASDAAHPDAARTDVTAIDVTHVDVHSMDVARTDVPSADAGHPDAGHPDAGPPPEPVFTSIPWSAPGYGVAYRDSENPLGDDVFIGYAGYNVNAAQGQAWVTQLFLDVLRARGVRHVYAVQGPRDSAYAAQEIGNSHLIADLLPRLVAGARILVAAHSSGGFVASELLQQLYARGLDPTHLTRGRLSYWDLDGATSGLTTAIIDQMHHAYFVWANDAATATRSPNAGVMISAGATWPAAGGALSLDASATGCNSGAVWCVHMNLITTHPHDPTNSDVALDYVSFDATHRVQTGYFTRTNFGLP